MKIESKATKESLFFKEGSLKYAYIERKSENESNYFLNMRIDDFDISYLLDTLEEAEKILKEIKVKRSPSMYSMIIVDCVGEIAKALFFEGAVSFIRSYEDEEGELVHRIGVDDMVFKVKEVPEVLYGWF